MPPRRLSVNGYTSVSIGCTVDQQCTYRLIGRASRVLGVRMPQRVILERGLIECERTLREEADRRGIPWARVVCEALDGLPDRVSMPVPGASSKRAMRWDGLASGYMDDDDAPGVND